MCVSGVEALVCSQKCWSQLHFPFSTKHCCVVLHASKKMKQKKGQLQTRVSLLLHFCSRNLQQMDGRCTPPCSCLYWLLQLKLPLERPGTSYFSLRLHTSSLFTQHSPPPSQQLRSQALPQANTIFHSLNHSVFVLDIIPFSNRLHLLPPQPFKDQARSSRSLFPGTTSSGGARFSLDAIEAQETRTKLQDGSGYSTSPRR